MDGRCPLPCLVGDQAALAQPPHGEVLRLNPSNPEGMSPAFPLQNTFRTPVYTTSMRRNAMGVGLVFEADLFTTKHISHWVLQGVCLTLNSD